MRHSIGKEIRRFLCFLMTFIMILTSMPVHLLAAYDYNDLSNDKSEIINNKIPVTVAKPEEGKTAAKLIEDPKQPATYTLRTDYKAEKGEGYKVNYQPYVATVGEAASDAEKAKVDKEIKLPDMAGYDKPKGEDVLKIKYDNIVKLAKHKTGDEKNGYKFLGIQDKNYKAKVNSVVIKHVFQDMDDFNTFTNGKSNTITEEKTVPKTVNGETKYVKEGLVYKKKADDNKFPSEPDETYDLSKPEEKAKFLSYEVTTTDKGNTGSTLEVQALQENQRPGFVPQIEKLKTQVPEDTSEFKIEYRYNRAHYNVVFDTQDGTQLPTRSYYYDQEIPKIDENSIPTKIGSEFLGWKPSHDLEGMLDGKKHIFKKNEIIKDVNRNAIVDLGNTFYRKDKNGKFIKEDGNLEKEKNPKDIQLKMPALALGDGKNIPREKLTFTAVWKDKEKADFAVQFWAEKADHADNASLLDKYDYMGTKVYKDIDVGFQPYLKDMPINGIVFPDLDKTRLQKIWKGDKFNRGRDLFLNKFFVYNKDLTDKENADPKNLIEVKKVSATGKTVYNIYYDRQVYDLYFTKSNAQPDKNTFYPEIYGRDQKKNELVKLGGPGNLYHYKARFNEMMYKWPNDAMQTKGFTEGYQSFGWGPNYASPIWPVHLDTPPYRLNADEFLDMTNYDNWGGFTKKIDKGDGTNIDLDPGDFTTLSFGIKQDTPSIPHHMDFWMDGFKDGETIIRYDLVRTKADTADPQYTHRYPKITGFKPYKLFIKEENQEDGRVKEDRIDELNDEREEITPYPGNGEAYYNIFGFNSHVGELKFIPAFFNDSDDFGDPLGGEESGFKENGYLQFHYHRNKYPLRFNYDPSKIKADTEFFYPNENGSEAEKNKANALESFYEFPLKCLSPDVDKNDEYKKLDEGKNPANLLDDPNNLYKLGLYDLLQRDKTDPSKFYQDSKGNYRVKRPEGLSDQMVFKGWALDPAGNKMVWKNPKETMPFHPLNLYAIWGEPDYKWKVTIDHNGGQLETLNPDKLTSGKKTIKEGDIGKEEEKTYPVAGYKDETAKDGTQIFTLVQKQKLNKLPTPTRYGYDFLGWEVIRYKKDDDGNYKEEVDNSYRERYKVPELYTFGEDVVSPITLKAIWVENKRADVKVKHYKLTKDFKLDEKIYPNPQLNTLEYKRVGDYVPTTGEKQDENWILATNDELMEKLPKDLKAEYEKYNNRVKMNNTFFQTFKVADNINVGTKEKPDYKPNPDNEFIFFYRPFRTRDYKVNYLDERGKKEIEEFYKGLERTDTAGLTGDDLLQAQEGNKKKFEDNKKKLDAILDKYKLVDQEEVVSQCRHFDARNYRPIPGWKLVSDPQQQLFYDVNEDTNEFLGINGTGGDQIFFYYKDARVIEVPKDGKTPDDYVRVTFKADKGGSFGKDAQGKDIKELNYDVIKGLKSDLLPVPQQLEEGKEKESGKYYITPEPGKNFIKWDNNPLLNANTIINEAHTFTANFDWKEIKINPLVVTESFKDPKNTWTNNFAPTVEKLKGQVKWYKNKIEEGLPAGVEVVFDSNIEKTIADKFKELGKSDKDELIREVKIPAKIKYADNSIQDIEIPVKVYKNVYEALNEKGDKPLFLKEAEGKEAKDGGLKDILKDNDGNRYIKVTIKPNKDFTNKDDKVYYVNPNAWVEIPEVETTGDSTFTNWTADNKEVNEEQKQNGVFDFNKRHKFTEDTIITPVGAGDVVEQEKGKDKPKVPENYVKVIVKTTDKATDETKFEKTFWVNPSKEVAIDVTNPTGKENQKFTFDGLGEKDVNYIFKEWQKVKSGEADDKLSEIKPTVKIDIAKHKYTDKVTVIEAAYKKSIKADPIVEPLKTKKLDTPQGKEITNDALIKQITPQEGKEIESIEVISKPDCNTVGNEPAKVIVKYKDGTTQGTNDNPVVIPVEVHKNIIPEAPGGQKPKDAMDNYVKVIFKVYTNENEADYKVEGGSLGGNLIYYVSPEVEVNLTDTAKAITKTPFTGYTANGENWTNKDNKTLQGKFTDEVTEFAYKFAKSKDIVEKTPQVTEAPKGYVTVIFKTDGNGKVGGADEKIYYVNPKAGIKLGKTATTDKKTLVVPKPTANENYEFVEWQEAIDETNPITSDRIHVANFKSGQVTLTYEAGEGAKGEVPAKVKVDHGTKVRLARPDGLSKPNAEFAGWKLDGEDKIYQPGDQVTLDKARTATAQWTAAKHTVTFDTDGGSKVPSQQVVHGEKLKPFTPPTQKGKVFMGWKEKGKENEKDYFDLTKPITQDKTLIAIWQDPVQKIGEKTDVESQFIKVTFNEGKHGKLKLADEEQTKPVIYKVAKDLTFDKAVKAGLKVPEIDPAKYYKAKDANSGWDKALELNGQNVEFIAQYEPQADVIPIDPAVTPDDKLQDDKPEGMVLVEFFVPEDEAYMDTTSKFYVAKEKEVPIKAPVVYNTVDTYEFTEWQGKTLQEGMLVESYTEDTQIYANGVEIPEMEIALPQAGDKIVKVIKNSDGATGKLVVIVNGEETVLESKEITKRKRKGRRFVTEKTVHFELPQAVQSGDSIKYWAEKDRVKSPIKYYTVE